ncbi:hypothetical protein [Oscillibacter sp. ER4]|uniref:hypothetical protein n=1 Tax=Oscillibacter sp. ER4 TaxID=1519439 RepID=UPI00051BFD9E|nr:hypothetical protein [Oscillibacter sp. ER4]
MVKVTFNNKPAQGKTAPVSPNKKTGGGVSIAFPNGIKKQGFIQTTPYQKALDEAILKASATDRRASSPMFRQQENVVTPDVQSAIMQGLMQDALQQQSAKKYQSPEAMKKAAEEPKKQTLGERVGNTLKGAAKTYGAGLANIAGERQIGANMQQRADMEKEIALWDQDIAAQKSVLSDPSATESERETARTVIETLEARKAAYRQAYNEGGVADQAANEIYKAADKMADSGARNIEKAKSGLGKVGQLAIDASVAGAQMGADAAASALTGGVALIPMFIRGAGSSAQEARRQGATHEQQVRYGTLSGALSVATEKIGNAATPFKKMFGKGFLDNVIERSVKGLNNSAAGKLVLSFLEEGGEEVLEDLVQPALQTIYNGRTVGGSYSELEAAEVLNDFLVGGILGGLGGGVDAIRNRGYYDSHTEMPKIEGTKPNTTAAQEKTATPETTAPISPRAPGAAAVMQNSTPAATPTARQQNTMPAQSAVTPESAQGTGEGHLTPTQQNAAQGVAEGKADALDAGKRVALDKYTTQENVQQVSQKINDGTLAVDAEHNIYRVNEDQHIDRRDSASVGERSVNAFQFDHPELHSYYADAAAVLQEEMSFAQKGGELIRRTSREAGDDEYIRTKRGVSERIARLLDDEGVRYDDIDRSLSAIIHNHGQENFAAAKRVELLLDDMLTNGYTDIHGQRIAPNEAYIAAKKAIPGADMSERTHEELPIYDMPEGQNGGIDNAGQETRNDAAGTEFADAAERGTPGEANAARALSDGAAERGERRGNGRESERIPREVRNVGGEDGNALTVQQRLAASGISQFISPREANVPNGASGDNTVTIFDEADWDQELIGAADWAKSKGVKKVTALLGVIKVEKDGKTGRIFGAFNADTGEIFVNAGSVQRSVSETIEHETAHYLAEVARRENVRTFMRDVQSRYSSEEWGKVYDAYFERYAALTDNYAGMSESDIELYVWEEIMGDAYAEIDQYDEKASRFNREAEDALSQSGQESKSTLQRERATSAAEQGRETAAATERRRGPPEKFSVLEEVEGENGTYGKGVMLDTNLFDGIRPRDWGKTLGQYVYNNMAGMELTAYDAAGKPETIYLARTNDRVQKDGAKNSHKVIDKLARSTGDNIRSLAVVHLDEALTTSRYENSTDEHNHQWMDENGWEYRKTYLQDRSGNIYEATLNIADGRDRKILYDINNIRLVDKAKSPGEHTAAGDSQRSRYQEPTAGDTQSEAKAGEITGGVVPSAVTGGARSTSRNFSEKRIADESENVKSPTLGDEIHRQIMGEENEPSQMPPGNRVLKSSELRAKAKLDDSSVSDGGGNVKPKTRFSLDEPVEETKTLVAMHNMTEEKLRRTLDIGAWPAPSIAIVKAKDGHTNYGEYSAVFPRETIDPQRSSKNKVYGGDAWTPTHDNAIVERGVNYEARRAFDENIKNLSSQFAGGVFQGSGTLGKIGLENETRWEPEEIADKLANHPEVQAAFLQSEGKSLEPVYRDKQFDRFFSNATIRRYLDTVGEQEVARLAVKLMTGERLTAEEMKPAEQAIREVYAEEHANFLNRRPESKEKRIDYYMKNNVFPNRVEDFIRSTQEFYESGGSAGEIDKEATAAKMMEMIAPGGSWNDALRTVKDWVQPQLEGLLGERGIYNGKDAVTDRGRRSFAETHWDYTAENIVKAMNMAAAKGANVYGITPETLAATATQEYRNVDEMHADEARLRTVSEEEHEKALRDLGIYLDRVTDDLLRTTKHRFDNTFEEEQNLSRIIAEAAKGKKTAAAVKAAFRKEGYAISDGHAKSILALIDRAANIPTGYYEAKPQRVVGFDEALAVVAPDDAPGDLLSEMRDAGMNVVEYRAGDDADRLDKINSIKNVRFSAEDEGGEPTEQQEQSYEKAERDGKRGDYRSIPAEWKTKLERARTAATNNIKPSGFDSYDAYLDALDKQRAADRAERLRVKSRDEFKGTKALDELGVKIANSAGIYHNAEQLIANDKAAKSIQNATKRAEQRLGATRQEKTIARDIVNGERSMADIPRSVKKSRVLELVDYYTAQKATKTGLLQQQRIEINDALREQARELIGTEAPEINRKGLNKLFDPSKGLVLYHRTPQRIMRALFGWKQGQQINEAVFEPVYENEQERKRFINRMFDEVRAFEGADGKKSGLNKDESAFAQRLKEGRTVEELVEKSGAAESIRAAAENLKNGAEMKDAARDFSLDKGSRDLARQYADWLQTQDDYAAAKNVDRTKVENAIEKYTELYDKLYAAINDFLVAHGYEPIGFIKGYAPHFQTSEANGKLESALKAIGVDLGSGVGKLPTSIAGLTKSFKPNKRYNPFFQHRRGNETDYDIVKGFETYVDYASDVLYHTDDIMRVRQMANYLRSTFAPEEMKADIDQMEAMRYAPADVKEEYLRDKKKITGDTFLSYEDLTNLMEQYTDEKYRSIEDATEFSDLVSWMDDYANKLAGKQLFEDRAMEREVGREALNGAKKLNRMFARANVAGNLSSALNQTAQLPMIATELGQKYTWRAVGDIMRGKTTGMSAFRGESDFLTEKSSIDYIQSTKGEKAIEKLFSPLEKVDTLVSTIAVRGKYRMELDAGKSPKEAMKAADRWARDIMGTRSKGSVPLTFQSKNLIAQMLNMFQVEAANTFEHVTQDRLGPGFKEMAAKIGKDKAKKKLASDVIAYMLLAFLLNRLDEDAYGGTPAPFDVLGMGLNAVASGNGLTSSDMLKMITDDVTENIFGERLFDTDPNDMNDEFDGWSAAEDTLYNISNDVPYVRNVAGLLGLGDETLPMPDLWGTATGIGKTLKKQVTGKFDSPGDFWSEVGRQLMGLAGDTLPGGRQLEKTAQGIEALARGGSYQGTGGSKRLQYPVEPPMEDPFEALRAALFGKNALNESRVYWAEGGKALSASQTTLYQELVDSGMSRKKAYETIRDFNDATADLEADKDENGNPVSGSKKEKVVEAINKLPLSRKQKDLLYLSRGYSEKDLGEMPWN